MEIKDLILIVLVVVTVIFGVSWALLIQRARSLFAGLCELREDYKHAIADGTITDTEKAEIADCLIRIIGDATSLWQMLGNMTLEILGIIRMAKRKDCKIDLAYTIHRTEG